jgi:hypothetical protein
LLGYSGWGSGANVILRSNLYWRAEGKPFDFRGKSWEAWRAAGHDQGSLIADPLFVDAARRDFRLRPGSPAEKTGFVPFDFTRAGVYGTAQWKQLAASTSFPEPYEVPKPLPVTLRDDFERGARSPLLLLASLDQEGRRDLITITNTTSASGQHSGRVQDQPDLKAAYNPHFYWDPHYTEGPARMAFRIRLEPGADVICEWRDASNPYRTGPSLRFRNNARFARDRKLLEVPESAWLAVEMRTVLGQAKKGWDCALRLPGGESRQFKELPVDPAWKEVRWAGFSSQATTAAVFYLDDLEMTPGE